MGTLFRSQDMQLVQLFVQIEAAHDTVDELGKLGLIEFRDLNPDVNAFQRNFVNEVKRCDEMERKARFFDEQVIKEKRDILIEKGQDPENLDLITLHEEVEGPKKQPIDELETQLDELEKELSQMNNNQEMLNRNYNELIELKYVLTKDTAFFSEANEMIDDEEHFEQRSLLSEAGQHVVDTTTNKAVKLGFVTGTILCSKFPSFERVLWRATRGNLFMKHAEIEGKIKDPHTGELAEKDVFIIFYQGERSQAKIKKICESFGANLYPCPNTPKERKDLLVQVNTRLEDLETVLQRTVKHRRQVLLDIGRHIGVWKNRILKEKAIYHTMNLFNYDIGRKCLIAEGWCPSNATEKIVNAMRLATESSGALVPSILSVIHTHETPPTYYQTNKFTRAFQAIVDAYGVAHYQEVNPTPFTIITFPFLFAVMFGDFGHGLLMTMFAAFLIYKEKQLGAIKLNELIQTCFDGRYVLILMGLFSIYTGLIYNECFSVAMDLFGSRWEKPFIPANASSEATYEMVSTGVYPFGVDPAWNGVPNSLNYYNSLKMKLSIILGVTHMCLGITMSLLNGIHHHSAIDIIAEFVPQILFMLSLFGYMVFLIFLKWSLVWPGGQAPLLLNVMISMFLSITEVSEENKLFDGQKYVQWALIFIAFISVPWMLLMKPYYLKHKYQSKLRVTPSSVTEEEDDEVPEEAFDFGEIFVKQIIHTIEFVLGAISNTASYLRLWALSLAHSELSLVFYERVLLAGFGQTGAMGYIITFVAFGLWAGATFAVLMVMESLSAFLHALRLHWVEFQNKFYHGDGRMFSPFSYEKLLKGETDE